MSVNGALGGAATAGAISALSRLIRKSEDIIGKKCAEWSIILLNQIFPVIVKCLQEKTLDDATVKTVSELTNMVNAIAPGKETSFILFDRTIYTRSERCSQIPVQRSEVEGDQKKASKTT